MKTTFTKKEVIELIRFYCKHQRILSQLPVPWRQYGITDEIHKAICDKIRIDANVEKFMPLEKENFTKRLKEIKSDLKLK